MRSPQQVVVVVDRLKETELVRPSAEEVVAVADIAPGIFVDRIGIVIPAGIHDVFVCGGPHAESGIGKSIPRRQEEIVAEHVLILNLEDR